VDVLAVFPDPPPSDLARTLDLAGYRWKGIGGADAVTADEPDGGWAGAVVCCDTDPDTAWTVARALRKSSTPVRLLALVTGGQLPDLSAHGDLLDDFCLTPFHPMELQARLQHLLSRGSLEGRPEMVEHSGLVLNLETYQAQIEGRPLDLTYMEYELLKFLSQNAGKVFTRETLLSRVWGYEYYGGARTVDVHIRRLRAKLGEEHANLIQTVRSVGYRFGTSRWGT
jgi:DNA-binding response OmpR family regulator